MQELEKWFVIAQRELKSAQLLAVQEDVFETAFFLCQQAGEKALKGYLAFKQQKIRKTHDLMELLELCLQFDTDFGVLYEAVRKINPYSTKFRYPSEFDLLDRNDAALAVRYAQSVVKFVLKKIVEPETGQANIFDK